MFLYPSFELFAFMMLSFKYVRDCLMKNILFTQTLGEDKLKFHATSLQTETDIIPWNDAPYYGCKNEFQEYIRE